MLFLYPSIGCSHEHAGWLPIIWYQPSTSQYHIFFMATSLYFHPLQLDLGPVDPPGRRNQPLVQVTLPLLAVALYLCLSSEAVATLHYAMVAIPIGMPKS